MTIQKYSYIRKYIFIFFILFIFSGCDIIDSIFGGDEEDNNLADNFTLIGSQTIGINGGEINLDSIIVEIPYGAFDNDNNISIHVGFDNDGFDEYGITSLFQLQGFPTTINKPIRLSIKHLGAIEGDTLIAIGEMQYATSLDSSLFSYETGKAADSLGYLVYNIPSFSGLGKFLKVENTNLNDFINFIGLGNYKKSKSSGGNFILSYPVVHETNAIKMGEHFENAYNKCNDMGFSLLGRNWQVSPAHVLAMPLKQGLGGFYTHSGAKTMTDAILRSWIIDGKFTINLGILSDDLDLRTTCGHEFLHLVQNLYEFSAPWIEPEQNWMKEATSTWVMEKFANVPNYLPSVHNGRELYPLVGWQFSSLPSFTHAEIGYGLSIIFKDIADRYGISEVVKIFNKIRVSTLPNNAMDPVEAVKSVVEWWEPLENFWHGVLSSYILGHYYNKQVNFKLLNMTSDWHKSGTIDPQNKQLIFNESYQDLSGKLFKVIPGDFSTLSTVPLSFSVDDALNCGILVCKYKQGTEITSIGEVYPGSSGLVTINDAKPIFDAGYELMVLVSNGSHDKNNNYEGINNVILTIDVVTPEILNGKVEFFLDAAVFSRSNDPNSIIANLKEILYLNDASGSFSNNVFNGNYSYQSLGRTFTGNVKITFIDNPESIDVYLDNKMSYEASFGYGTRVFEYTIGYSGIPFEGIDPNSGQYLYADYGTSVSKINVTWRETNSLYTQTLTSYTCGTDAYIKVAVDKRE